MNVSSGPTVVITGAAGALGAATALAMRDAGFRVVGLDLDPRIVEAAWCDDGVQVDVTDERALTAAFATLPRSGTLHHLIQIAGGALPEEPRTQHDPSTLPAAAFRASVDRNLTSSFLVLQAALPWLRASPEVERSVILTSSFNALGAEGMPAYSAAKAGLIGMMYGLVRPLGAEGIRINTVAPGTIRTPRTERIWGHVDGHFDRLEAASAMGRLGTPEDVARTIRSVTVDLTHVCGQVLVVDGGQSC